MSSLLRPILLSIFAGALTVLGASAQDDGIRPYSENPRYWQYEGEPVLLIGGSNQDNLFQISDLEGHLDLMKEVGANYVRNTMSARDSNNVRAFERLENRKYDLSEWNEVYWDRLRRFLEATSERDIIVQIEVWATWDFNYEEWQRSPWYPANNLNYSFKTTKLKADYGNPMMEDNDFWRSVPSVNDDEVLLRYQKRFVNKLLAITLEYDHVLYSVSNEVHPSTSLAWSFYWARHIRRASLENGKDVQITQMHWSPEMRSRGHRTVINHPEVFDFFDASQNTSNKDAWHHWRNFLWVREALEESPRPINVVKTYGSEAGAFESAPERMWRHLIMGAASTRFHRPPNSYGLEETAQTHLESMRMWLNAYDLVQGQPDGASGWGGGFELLENRERAEAYCNFVEASAYSVYFPDGGSVTLDAPPGAYEVRWLDIEANEWRRGEMFSGDEAIDLTTPESRGHWMAVVVAE